MSHFEDLLKNHGLKKTQTRLDVLEVLHDKDYALDHAELSDELGERHDRVTVYRTLNSFEDKGLIHSILMEDGVKKFALCGHNCETHNHVDNHVHFTCSECEKTYCLEDFNLDLENKHPNYLFENISITATGICPNCKK